MKRTTSMTRTPVAIVSLMLLAACGSGDGDPNRLARDETLLSVSATGQADTRPDKAQFQAGIVTYQPTAKGANDANLIKISQIIGALKELGIAEKDIQTRVVTVQRIDWGDKKGQFQSSNVVTVTVRDLAKAGAAIATATAAGANIISGPNLQISDTERAATGAYTNAYLAARQRAEAYAKAANMQIARVIAIRDSGGMQGDRFLRGAVPVSPPPVMEQAQDASAGVMAGQTTSLVSVQVDFALRPK